MIYYASVPLANLTEYQPGVRERIERFISTLDVRECYRTQWPAGLHSQQTFNLPAGNFPYHAPKLGSLFWPAGAWNWAIGHFLVTDSSLQSIRQPAYSQGTLHALPFRIDDGMGGVMQTNLFMLPPRPIFQIAGREYLYL